MAARLLRDNQEIEQQLILRTTKRTPIANPKSKSVSSTGVSRFTHSTDFRTIHYRGQRYELTSRQAQIVAYLYKEYQKGMPEVSQHTLLEELGTKQSMLRDAFRKSPLWGTLIVPGRSKRRGMYQLNL